MSPSEHPGVTLREYAEMIFREHEIRYEQRFQAQEKAVQASLDAANTAVGKAEAANEKRFDAASEFREQLASQAATFVPRRETEQRWIAFDEALKELRGTTRGGLQTAWSIAVAIISLAISIVVAIVLIVRG
jgi:hypothetical protein